MNNESEELALTFIEIHITQQRERVPKKQKNKKMRQLSRDLETDSAFSQVPIYCSAREDLSPSCVLVRDSSPGYTDTVSYSVPVPVPVSAYALRSVPVLSAGHVAALLPLGSRYRLSWILKCKCQDLPTRTMSELRGSEIKHNRKKHH
ncbi:hypothetical protein KQX54_004635 [Cotesia glomerata]|uniref:Uncharacterized protein n=1 Tax=Cotesia glomerata TaxID=32391 RepID=A0AAV7J7D8_COTGL|nr:hypothetical protein KQX54_004635 [Cotesia glomerata]